jgi:dienelactone hydrolase
MKFLKRLVSLLVLLLALYGGWALFRSEPVTNIYELSDFTQAPDGVVGFPSFNAMSSHDIANGGVTAVKQSSGGLLVLPAGASKENPVPAVVILHGSGGDWSGRSVAMANQLAKHGIAGFAVDTFVARNLRKTDNYYVRIQKAPIYTQIVDAYKALEALNQHPFIQHDKIGVTGFSFGAASTLYTMFEQIAEGIVGKNGPRFSAFASFYAGCSFDVEDFRTGGKPVLMMMGGKDESMSIPRCEWLRDKLRAHHTPAQLIVYPEAGHGWDLPYPMYFSPDAAVTKDCLLLWDKQGSNKELNAGWTVDSAFGAMMAFTQCTKTTGYLIGEEPQAKRKSWEDFYAFLQDVWQLGDAKSQ